MLSQKFEMVNDKKREVIPEQGEKMLENVRTERGKNERSTKYLYPRY